MRLISYKIEFNLVDVHLAMGPMEDETAEEFEMRREAARGKFHWRAYIQSTDHNVPPSDLGAVHHKAFRSASFNTEEGSIDALRVLSNLTSKQISLRQKELTQ